MLLVACLVFFIPDMEVLFSDFKQKEAEVLFHC